jgi:hypothetical protein
MRFSNDFGTITTQTTLTYVTPDCTSFFSPSDIMKFGASVQCSIAGGIMTIVPSFNATIIPLQTVQINSYADQPAAPALYAPNTIQPPFAPIGPTPLIAAPSSIGSCSDLVLTTANSFNADKRPVTYLWGSTDSSLNATLNTIIDTSVTIASLQMTTGQTYTITLTMTNFFGYSTNTNVSVVKSSNYLPTVSIATLPTTFYLSQDVVIDGIITYPACYQGVKTRTVSWSTSSTISGFSGFVLNQQRLIVPAFSFPSAGTYTLQFNVIPDGTGTTVTTIVTIKIVAQNLVASIGGGATQVTVGQSVLLSSFSADPDMTTEDPSYVWSCSSSDVTYSCPPLDAAATNQFSLTGPSNFTFTLIFVKGSRNATAQTWVVSVTAQVPMVVVNGPSVQLWGVNSIVFLTATATRAIGDQFDYLWSQDSGTPINLDDPTVVITSKTSQTLVVKTTVLIPGSIMFFRVQATVRGSAATNYATVQVVVTVPPTIGYAMVSPTSGVTLSTQFSISCAKFGGISSVLQYQITAETQTSVLILSPWSTANSILNVFLPVGSPVIVRCSVIDQYNATGSATSSVSVTTASTTTGTDGIIQTLNSVTGTGGAIGTATEQGATLTTQSITCMLSNQFAAVFPQKINSSTACANDCTGTDGVVYGDCGLSNSTTLELYVCTCYAGRAGPDCRFTEVQFATLVALRSPLVISSIQSLDRPTVNYHGSLLSCLSQTASLLSTAARSSIYDSLAVLHRATLNKPLITGDASNMIAALSNVQFANGLDRTALTFNFTDLFNNVVSGNLRTKFTGEPDTYISGVGIQLVTSKKTVSDSTNNTIATTKETLGLPARFLPASYKSTDDVQVGLVSTSFNPLGNQKQTIVSNLVEFSVYAANFTRVPLNNTGSDFSLTMQGAFDTRVRSSGSIPSCKYWNVDNQMWQTDGCYVLQSNFTHIRCACNHTTLFAGFLEPFALLGDYTTLITTCVVTGIWIIGQILLAGYGTAEENFKLSVEDKVSKERGRFAFYFEKFKESHLYLSLFARLQNSRFTRAQRWTVIYVTIMAILEGALIVYTNIANITFHYVGGAAMSCLYAFPFTILFSILFSKAHFGQSVSTDDKTVSNKNNKSTVLKTIDHTIHMNTDFEMEDVAATGIDEEEQNKPTVGPTHVDGPKDDLDAPVALDTKKEVPPQSRQSVAYSKVLHAGDNVLYLLESKMHPILFTLLLVAGFLAYSLVWAAITALYAALVGAGLQSGSGATAVVCVSILGYLSSFLFIYADVKYQRFLENKMEGWTTVPTWISFAISIVITLITLAVGVALVVIGGIFMYTEMIIVGGTCVVFALVLVVWTLSHVIPPRFMEVVRQSNFSTHVSVAIVYALAAAVTIVHIVTVIYYGYKFSVKTQQPSYWLYSILIAILFELVLVKAFIFLLDIFGVSTLYKFIEIVFFKETWAAPTPTEVYELDGSDAIPSTRKTNSRKTNKAIKGATQETFEKGFEQEEFGNLGPIEEDKPAETKHPEHDVEEEEEATGPKDVIESIEPNVEPQVESIQEVKEGVHNVEPPSETKMDSVEEVQETTETKETVVSQDEQRRIERHEALTNPTHVSVEDMF